MPEDKKKPEASEPRVLTDQETQDISGGQADDPPNPVTDPNDPVPPPPPNPPGG